MTIIIIVINKIIKLLITIKLIFKLIFKLIIFNENKYIKIRLRKKVNKKLIFIIELYLKIEEIIEIKIIIPPTKKINNTKIIHFSFIFK